MDSIRDTIQVCGSVAEADKEAEADEEAEVDSVEGKEIFEGIMAVYSLMGEEQIG